jgi:hypothetical protein
VKPTDVSSQIISVGAIIAKLNDQLVVMRQMQEQLHNLQKMILSVHSDLHENKTRNKT